MMSRPILSNSCSVLNLWLIAIVVNMDRSIAAWDRYRQRHPGVVRQKGALMAFYGAIVTTAKKIHMMTVAMITIIRSTMMIFYDDEQDARGDDDDGDDCDDGDSHFIRKRKHGGTVEYVLMSHDKCKNICTRKKLKNIKRSP